MAQPTMRFFRRSSKAKAMFFHGYLGLQIALAKDQLAAANPLTQQVEIARLQGNIQSWEQMLRDDWNDALLKLFAQETGEDIEPDFD